jgi:hypothetical protein
MKTLIYCLDILKIEKDSEFYRDDVQKNLIESANESDEWISATKIIAYTYSSLKTISEMIVHASFPNLNCLIFDVICKRHRRQKNEFRNNNLQNL